MFENNLEIISHVYMKIYYEESLNILLLGVNKVPIEIKGQIQPNKQGPIVQSIVSLTSALRGQLVKCLMTK